MEELASWIGYSVMIFGVVRLVMVLIALLDTYKQEQPAQKEDLTDQRQIDLEQIKEINSITLRFNTQAFINLYWCLAEPYNNEIIRKDIRQRLSVILDTEEVQEKLDNLRAFQDLLKID